MSRLWSGSPQRIDTVQIDRGGVFLVVTENGTLESSDNATVRCEVEALLGVNGMAAGGAQGGARPGGTAAQGGQGGGGAGGGAGGAAQGGSTPAPAAPAATKKGATGAAAKSAAGGAKAKATGAGVASADTAAAPSPTSATATADATSSTLLKRPNITSFSYIVEPHIPLRGATPKTASTTQIAKSAALTQQQQQQNGGGSGRGGNRGGNNGGNQQQQQTGSTRILWILPEGTPVKKGDVVCQLDASAFKDELQVQQIRHLQAKAWVEQAQSILEVNEISLREFEQGIYPQDIQLIRQYIQACETEYDRASGNLKWSIETAKKGYRSSAQVKADELAAQQADIALREAQGMLVRLENFTGKRIEKARKAKIEAIRADKLSLESTFQLETERLKRLERMVEKCTMRAPRDGVVVYFNQSNSWGQVEASIQEGVTVRQSQPIFSVPNSKFMQVRARINESKYAQIYTNQRATIRVDAFPDRVMQGTVTEITAIPAPANGPVSDVRIYYAMVRIESGGFDSLRPGLSAEVNFEVGSQQEVTRIPLEAIRWVGRQPFAALQLANSHDQGLIWRWNPLELGMSDSLFAEVVSGVKPGDRVISSPDALTPPKIEAIQAGSPAPNRTRARG